MAVYAIAQGRVTDREGLDGYARKAVRSIGAAGGTIVGFSEVPEIVEGTVDTPRTVIIRFESKDAFRAWYDSPEYQAFVRERWDSAPGSLIVVDGIDR